MPTTSTIKNLHALEQEIGDIYTKILIPHSKAFATREPEHHSSAKGTPSVLFLGNHSSGKSSFINYLLGEELQKTGVAPVDDGFTVIHYGEEADQFDGHAMATHGDLPYSGLEAFGDEFLSRAKLKTRPLDWLKNVTLIDSPGMIDSPESQVNRGYDFGKSVRFFAEHADLILFFFDPDKPGTTGETMRTFKESLMGTEHKQLILLHKVDSFDNIRDFARTYGALCWNLSKTVSTKDMPHIHVTYIPGMPSLSKVHIPLADFDIARNEVIDEIKRVPIRRLDNLVTELHSQAQRLSMLGRVINQIANHYRSIKRQWGAGLILATAALAAIVWYLVHLDMGDAALKVGAAGAAIILVTILTARLFITSYKRNCNKKGTLDKNFDDAYGSELINKDRTDLQLLWDRQVRDQVRQSIEAQGIENMPSNRAAKKSIAQCEKIIKQAPGMRRKIGRPQEETTEEKK